MATTTVLYKSFTLQPGEQFTLPPNSELIGADNVDGLESTCTIPELEDLTCYALVFGNGEDDGDNSQLFEASGGSNTPAQGIKFNGTYYQFASPFYANNSGIYNLADIITAINSTAAGTLIFNAVGGFNWQGDNGVMSYIVFKTIPSIAEALQLWMSTAAPDIQTLDFLIPVKEYADVSSYTNIPSCS